MVIAMQLNEALPEGDFESMLQSCIRCVEFHKGFRDFIQESSEKIAKVTGVLLVSIKTGDGVALLEVQRPKSINTIERFTVSYGMSSVFPQKLQGCWDSI